MFVLDPSYGSLCSVEMKNQNGHVWCLRLGDANPSLFWCRMHSNKCYIAPIRKFNGNSFAKISFLLLRLFFIFCIGSKKWLYSIRFWMRHEPLEMSLFDNVRYSCFEFSWSFSNYNYDGMLAVLHMHRVLFKKWK